MARPGISKGEVQRARLVLIKAGKHPSIDSIRIELGNTGSKATIFRFLKEIEADEGSTGLPQGSISDELQAFVTNLAARLEFESQERLDVLKAGHVVEVRRLNEALEKTRGEAKASRGEAERSQVELSNERATRQRVEADLDALRLEHRQVTTQLSTQLEGVREQLRDAQAHMASLEEKHTHAWDSLEHFRTASREQRDREARQHEQQLQYLQREVAQAAEALTGKHSELRAALQEASGRRTATGTQDSVRAAGGPDTASRRPADAGPPSHPAARNPPGSQERAGTAQRGTGAATRSNKRLGTVAGTAGTRGARAYQPSQRCAATDRLAGQSRGGKLSDGGGELGKHRHEGRRRPGDSGGAPEHRKGHARFGRAGALARQGNFAHEAVAKAIVQPAWRA